MTNVIYFSPFVKGFIKTKGEVFYYNGYGFHLRKDIEYIGDKKQKWLITDIESCAIFAKGDTIKEALICMDIIFECISIREIEEIRTKVMAKQFEKIRDKFKYK